MDTLILNGRFFTQPLTGVQRYAFEILRELSAIENLKVIVALPPDAELPEGFAGVVFVKVGKLHGEFWEQWSLPRYCRKMKYPLLNTGNHAPMFFSSNVILHDVIFNEKYSAQMSKRWVEGSKIQVRGYIYRTNTLFTVSEFSKERILHFYPRLKKEPVIVHPGHEHIARIACAEVEGVPEEFYLSVGSSAPNKNFEYVLRLAKNNPNKNFLITGRKPLAFEDFIRENDIKNCIFTGYLSDGQLTWLYKKCKGFILPSVYEGFGLPPLEAVAAGCRNVFLADIPVFKEIYGGFASYFDPTNYENTVDLNAVPLTDVQAEELLNKYRWRDTALKIYNTIFSYKGK